ncbi:MAG: recombinase family protein [Bacilli bacterium]
MDIRKARENLRNGKTIYDMNLRVGYYARVSTDKDDQLNSLENQQKFFEEMIKENKNWTIVRGYIDEGISGTAVKHRDSFLKMIEDATLGKIDLILTKEISRFSRNTVDSIKYTEYLLKQGVIVYFLSDNLNTIQEDAEFRLTIMSSMAQDEVRKLSERVKFGINRMIKDKKLIGGNLTGYYKKDGRYEINPNEEPIIKYLFTTYASGSVGLKKIGEELAEMGYLNSKGEPYSQTTLAKMLSNPRYKGYYTAKLTEVEDYKTHKKKKVPKEDQIIFKDERIPAIVSEELWDKANLLHEKRKKLPSRHVFNSEEHIKKYKYSAKLYCKDCNSIFIRSGGGNRALNPTWACKTYKINGVSKCESPIIKESYLDKVFIDIFNDFIKHKKDYLGQVLTEYKNIVKNYTNDIDIDDINKKIEQLEKQKDKLLDLSLKGIIDDYEFKKRNDKFNTELFSLQSQIENSQNQNIEEEKLRKKLSDLESCLTNKLDIKENLPYLVNLLVDKVIVEKVNNDRKHVRLTIYFDFNSPDIDIDLDMNEKNELKEKSLKTLACRRNSSVLKCSCIDTKQPWICRTWKKTWSRDFI